MHSMNEVNPSLVRTQSMIKLATETGVIRDYRNTSSADIENFAKWPVWLRIVLIVGLSASLWAGIILFITALL